VKKRGKHLVLKKNPRTDTTDITSTYSIQNIKALNSHIKMLCFQVTLAREKIDVRNQKLISEAMLINWFVCFMFSKHPLKHIIITTNTESDG
jgi:hypothetical protein